MSYPFGKEETATEEQLFEFFCECLRRGDWELAQACVPQLHRGQGEIPQKVEDILQALVQCPVLLRCGPDINPQKLAWLWLLVLEKWLAPEKKFLSTAFRRKLEFLFLSEDLQGDIPETILKELFETLAQGPVGSIPDRSQRCESGTPQLSPEAVSILWNLLKQAPRPAQALLELLLGDHHSASLCPSPLQKSLLDFIREALQTLRNPASQPPGVADAVCGALQALCCTAALPESEWRVLCEELLETCRTEGSPLQEERLFGCLLHKAGRSLLSLYGHIYAEKVAERPSKATLSGKDHPDPERAMLALFSTPDPAHAWKMAFFYCLSNNKHFLEQILVTALTLLKEEDFPSLGYLLDREFRPLSHLLVLLGWTHCQSLESAKRLLQTLHRTQDQGHDELLRDACEGLWAHLEVLECSLIPKRELLCHLHGGDSHSVLYSLHHLTNLPALNEEEVLKLLQKEPTKDLQGEHGASHLFPMYLARCRQYLHSIPASLCLEILENIFSLLLITSANLHPEPHLPEDYAEDEDIKGKGPLGLRSPPESTQHLAETERRSERASMGPRNLAHTVPSCPKAESKDSSPGPHKHSFLDLKHFTSGVNGFLADEFAIGAFLSLLQEQLSEISSHHTPEETKLPEDQSCPASQRWTAEPPAQVLKGSLRGSVVTSNQGSEEHPSQRYRPIATRHSSLRRGRRTRRTQMPRKEAPTHPWKGQVVS